MSKHNWVQLGANGEARDMACCVKSGDEGCSFPVQDCSPDQRAWFFDQLCALMIRFTVLRAEDAERSNKALEALL